MSGITLRHAGPFKVKGQLSEYELASMKVGQEVTVSSKQSLVRPDRKSNRNRFYTIKEHG